MPEVQSFFKDPKPPRNVSGRARPNEPLALRCEICNADRATQRHHKLRRSQGGTDDATNTLDLCGPDHARVHANPSWSYLNGYLIRSTT